MLKQIKFKNYKSFVNETTFSFEKSKLEILDDKNTSDGILKGAAFYGSNAAGKTNAINAISILLDLLFKDSNQVNPGAQITLFSNAKTACFEYVFDVDGNEIVYYFEVDRNNKFTKETLKLNGDICLNRLLNSAESFVTENKDYNADDVDEKTLFLRNIYFNTKFSSYPILAKWLNDLRGSIFIGSDKLVHFSNVDEALELHAYLEKNGDKEINDFFDTYNFPFRIKYNKMRNPQDAIIPFEIRLFIVRKNLADIPFLMESYGNRRFLSILPAILTASKRDSMLFVDEFGCGLHNKLEELLIRYFMENSSNGQLFFVSHSTNLLKTSLLRPDQIFSVDFDEHGSFVKKFSDEHPRESQNLEKMYLSGVFGGIPLYD